MAGETSKDKTSKGKASKSGAALTHIDASGEARMVDVSAKGRPSAPPLPKGAS